MSYVGLSVQVHGTDLSPEAVKDQIEEIIRSNWDSEYEADIEVDIEEFSRTE